MMEEENELSKEVVEKENPLKQLFIDYVGNKTNPENGEVTIEMCVDALAEEFPDFLLLVAQENFIRGYRQCLADMEKAADEQKSE
jgi:hypothetical protein